MEATIEGTIPPGAGMAIMSVTGHLGSDFGNYSVSYSRP
jgi:hypothetical protein